MAVPEVRGPDGRAPARYVYDFTNAQGMVIRISLPRPLEDVLLSGPTPRPPTAAQTEAQRLLDAAMASGPANPEDP